MIVAVIPELLIHRATVLTSHGRAIPPELILRYIENVSTVFEPEVRLPLVSIFVEFVFTWNELNISIMFLT